MTFMSETVGMANTIPGRWEDGFTSFPSSYRPKLLTFGGIIMPTTYAFANRGHGMPYGAPGDVAFKANINIPNLIANGGLDADLPSTGFGASDVLQVFEVPAGFLLTQVGVRVTTVEGGACTADIGNASASQTHLKAIQAVGYMGTCDLNVLTTQVTLVTDLHLGADLYQGVVFITDGTIDFTFITAATAVAVFDIWATGWRVF